MKAVVGVLCFWALSAFAQNQTGAYWHLPPIPCTGGGAGWTAPISGPKEITAAAFVEHIGTSPVRSIAGIFWMWVQKPDGRRIYLVTAQHREGSKKWDHNPPILMEAGDTIQVDYGCVSGLEHVQVGSSIGNAQVPVVSLNPDVYIYWKE